MRRRGKKKKKKRKRKKEKSEEKAFLYVHGGAVCFPRGFSDAAAKWWLRFVLLTLRWFIVPVPFVSSMQPRFPTSRETPIPIAYQASRDARANSAQAWSPFLSSFLFSLSLFLSFFVAFLSLESKLNCLQGIQGDNFHFRSLISRRCLLLTNRNDEFLLHASHHILNLYIIWRE